MIHSLKKALLLVCVWLVSNTSYAQTVRVIDNKGTINEVDGSIFNEINTSFAVIGTNLVITDSNGTLSVPLASLGTDNQNIDVLTLNSSTNILTVGIEDGNDLTVDLNGLIADGSETIVTGAGINLVTGIGTTADPYVITATEIDGSITNEVNTFFAVIGTNLAITDSNGTLSVPLTYLDSKLTQVVTAGNTIATHVSASGVSTAIIETNTAITQMAASNTDTEVTAGDANTIAVHTNEGGTTTTINETVSTLIDNGDDSFTYTDETGTSTSFTPATTVSSTILVDQSVIWAGNVNDNDIHSNGTLQVTQKRSDTNWNYTNPSTIKYTGRPDHVRIDLMAVANNTGNHWAHPHIRVFRNGVQIGEGGAIHMDNGNSYSGRSTSVISMIDPNPGTNPVYTFTTLEDDTRTMNNPTFPNLSPLSLVAIEKVSVVRTITTN